MRTFTKQCNKLKIKFQELILIPLFSIFFKIEGCFKKSIQTRYLILKTTGGMTHFLRGLAHCIELSKKFGYFIIIDSKSATSFATEFKNLFYLIDIPYSEDYSLLSPELQKLIPANFSKKPALYISSTHCRVKSDPEFFIKISQIQIKNIKKLVQFYAGSGYSIRTHTNTLFHYLRIQDSIKNKILKKAIQEPYVGLHFRNTDMKHDINPILKKIQVCLLKQKKINLLYIATDDISSIKKFKKFIVDFNQKTSRQIQCLYQKNIPTASISSTHYIPANDLKKKFGLDKVDFHIQVLQDIFLLYNASFFIPSSKSGLSIFVKNMRKKKKCFVMC